MRHRRQIGRELGQTNEDNQLDLQPSDDGDGALAVVRRCKENGLCSPNSLTRPGAARDFIGAASVPGLPQPQCTLVAILALLAVSLCAARRFSSPYAEQGPAVGHLTPHQGASRGIGRAIALRAARDGANIVIAAKTVVDHPKLPGTIFTVAKEVEAAGGKALPIECDIRSEEAVAKAVQMAVDKFGGIDVLVNNASAIWPRPILDTPMKRYDLMHSINGRGTFLCSQACLPWLRKSAEAGRNPHILNLSPPLDLNTKWFANQVAYTISKYNMSMVALGLAKELEDDGIAVNALWPRTAIATAAIEFISGPELLEGCRKPEIMGDSAYVILTSPARACTGGFFIDDEVLRGIGMKNLDHYAVDPSKPLVLDYFVEDDGSLGGNMATLKPKL